MRVNYFQSIASTRKPFQTTAAFLTVALSLAFTLTQATPAHADTLDPIRTVAVTGDQAPNASSGVTFDNLGISPVINASGQTAFRSFLSGSGVNSSNRRGVYSEGSGSLSQIARQGDQVPNANSGVVFDGFSPIVLNDSGQIAFRSTLSGTGVDSSNNAAIYSEGSGTLTQIARSGQQSPDLPNGVVFNGVSQFVTLNSTGKIAFRNDLSGTGVDFTNDRAIYSDRSGTLTNIVREGDQVSNAPAGTVFSFLNGNVINDSGQIAFFGTMEGPGIDNTNNTGIYTDTAGTLRSVATKGDQAPGAPAGTVFSSLNLPVINSSGNTAFTASITGTNVTSSNNFGLYSEGSGTLSQIARKGEQAPGTQNGIVFGGFAPVLNTAGQTAFRATLDGTSVDVTNNTAIYSEGSGTLSLIAREGEQASGAPNGVLFGDFAFDDNPILNTNGQVAFIANLSGIGVDGTNDRGIFATDLNGVLKAIVREGDLLDINDDPLITDMRTISFLGFADGFSGGASGNGDGRASGFNDAGQLVFHATFTDGSRGIFVSNLVSDLIVIPEPTTLVLFAISGPLLLRRRNNSNIR